uniref:Uncharacterized protein n=1 Tax=Globodera pallida TaxID=36090 RepID=A0A183BIU4_GLOPA
MAEATLLLSFGMCRGGGGLLFPFLFKRHFQRKNGEVHSKMGRMAEATLLLSFALLGNLLHRSALARVGRSTKVDGVPPLDFPLAESPLYLLVQPPRLLHRFPSPLSSVDQPKLRRFERSLYGVDGSSAIMRSQRGLLQTPEEQRNVIVIDADDGQLMRYGKR